MAVLWVFACVFAHEKRSMTCWSLPKSPEGQKVVEFGILDTRSKFRYEFPKSGSNPNGAKILGTFEGPGIVLYRFYPFQAAEQGKDRLGGASCCFFETTYCKHCLSLLCILPPLCRKLMGLGKCFS